MKLFLLLYCFFFLSGFTNKSEIKCLAENIYFESRDQKLKGQVAVALVTINRVSSRRFPNTICKVVKQAKRYRNGKIIKHKCQFSWYCDGLPDIPRDRLAWKVSIVVARAMLNDPKVQLNRYGEKWDVSDFLGGATHYHRIDINPYWNRNMLKKATIGDHVFYIDPYR